MTLNNSVTERHKECCWTYQLSCFKGTMTNALVVCIYSARSYHKLRQVDSPVSSEVKVSEDLSHLGSQQKIVSREVWMYYRGPGFLSVIWFRSSPRHSPVSTREDWARERQLADGRGDKGGGRSQIIRRRESLVLYNTLNTLRFFVSKKTGRSTVQ
jgi:hypothetical protein